MGRAASDARVRQIGRPRFEFHLVEVEPESVGCDLGERGPGALAHVVRSRLHHAGAVAS